jgi:hypothetical protein
VYVGNKGRELLPAGKELRAVLLAGNRKGVLFGRDCCKVFGQPGEALDGALAA